MTINKYIDNGKTVGARFITPLYTDNDKPNHKNKDLQNKDIKKCQNLLD